MVKVLPKTIYLLVDWPLDLPLTATPYHVLYLCKYQLLIHQFLEKDGKELGKGRGKDSSLFHDPWTHHRAFLVMRCLLYTPRLQDWQILDGALPKPPGDLGTQEGLGHPDAGGTSRHTGGIYKNATWRPREVK